MLIQCLITSMLALVAIIGDYLVSCTPSKLLQACFDNSTHAAIGSLSWLLVCHLNKKFDYIEIIFCTLLASLIDLDHFVAAKSFYLKDATSLKHRPFLHCSTIPLITFVVLILLNYFLQSAVLKQFSLIILTAFASHHTRDATRRGYWFFPFKSTAAVPYTLYLLLTCLIPYFIYLLDKRILKLTYHYKYKEMSIV